MFIKFTKDHAPSGRKLGDVWEADEGIARAYIGAGVAAEHKEAESDLVTTLSKTVADGMAAMQRAYATQLDEVNQGLQRGFRTAGSSFNPRLVDADNGESEDDKFLRRGGFKDIGHFAKEMTGAGNTPSLIRGEHPNCPKLGKYNDTLMRRAVATPDGMYENSEPDGGALIPPDFTTQIWERVYSQENILGRTQSYTVSGNTMTIPANAETSRADGSRWGGVLSYWEGEAQQLTGSRPKFRNLQERLKKLAVLTYITNELLSDSATALEQYISRVAPDEIAFKTTDALINGNGAGIPLGIINDPAFIQVAKDTGQATKTISYTNVMNIYNTMWAPSRARAIWCYNQEIEPQLWQMALPVGTGGVPVFQPPGVGNGVTGSGSSTPYTAQLYGRPAIPLEQCPGLGSVGDLMLIDWSQYITITKGSIQSAMSIHLKFDFDETAFRWIFRLDGQGAWSAPLTPFKTNLSKTFSFAVGLAVR